MAAPTYVGRGASAKGTGALTAALPAAVEEGDFLLLMVETANQAVPAISGWAEVPASPQGTGTASVDAATRLTLRYKIAGPSEGSAAVGDSGNHQIASIAAWRGVDPADPINASAGDVLAVASRTITIPGLVTTVPECLIVALSSASRDIDTTGTQFTDASWLNASLDSVTEFVDDLTDMGTGGGLGGIYGVKATAGTVDATAGLFAGGTNTNTQGRIALALAPIAAVEAIYKGGAGQAARYLGSRTEAQLYVGAGNLWP